MTEPPMKLSKAVEELEYQLSTYQNATNALMAEMEQIDLLLLGVAGRTREERIQTLLEWQRTGRAAMGAAGVRLGSDPEQWCRDRRTEAGQIPLLGKRSG